MSSMNIRTLLKAEDQRLGTYSEDSGYGESNAVGVACASSCIKTGNEDVFSHTQPRFRALYVRSAQREYAGYLPKPD